MSRADPSRVYDADFEEVGDQRHSADRRRRDRRAARAQLDTLFAATLVNQITPAEAPRAASYRAPRRLRAGIAFDVKA